MSPRVLKRGNARVEMSQHRDQFFMLREKLIENFFHIHYRLPLVDLTVRIFHPPLTLVAFTPVAAGFALRTKFLRASNIRRCFAFLFAFSRFCALVGFFWRLS